MAKDSSDSGLKEQNSFHDSGEIGGKKPSITLDKSNLEVWNGLKELLNSLKERLVGKHGELESLDVQTKRQFVRSISQYITKFKSDFIGTDGIDIESIVENALDVEKSGKTAKEELIKEVKGLLVQAIRLCGDITIRNSYDVTSSADIDQIKNNSNIDDRTLENVISNICASHVEVGRARINLENMRNVATANIINEYRKNLIDKILDGTSVGVIRLGSGRRNPIFGGLSVGTDQRKQASFLVTKLYQTINYGLILHTMRNVGKFVASVYKVPAVIIKHAYRFAAGLVSSLFSGISTYVFKPLFRTISFSIGLITKTSVVILKTLKKVVKYTAMGLGAILLTPMGMYSLGFLLGFVWEKIKQNFGNNGKIENFDDVMEMFSKFGIFCWQKIDRYMTENHPKAWGYFTGILDRAKKFGKETIKTLENNFEWITELLEGNTLQKIIDSVNKGKEWIKDQWKWLQGTSVYKTIEKIGSFVEKHWLAITSIAAFLWTTWASIKGILAINRLLCFVPGLGKIGFFQRFAIAAMIGGASALGDIVFDAFEQIGDRSLIFANKSRSDMNNSKLEYKTTMEYRNNLKGKDLENFIVLDRILNDESNTANELMERFSTIKEQKQILKKDEDDDKNDLYELLSKNGYSSLIESVNSPFSPEIVSHEILKKKGTTSNQLNFIFEVLRGRMQNISNAYYTLSNRIGNKDVDGGLLVQKILDKYRDKKQSVKNWAGLDSYQGETKLERYKIGTGNWFTNFSKSMASNSLGVNGIHVRYKIGETKSAKDIPEFTNEEAEKFQDNNNRVNMYELRRNTQNNLLELSKTALKNPKISLFEDEEKWGSYIGKSSLRREQVIKNIVYGMSMQQRYQVQELIEDKKYDELDRTLHQIYQEVKKTREDKISQFEDKIIKEQIQEKEQEYYGTHDKSIDEGLKKKLEYAIKELNDSDKAHETYEEAKDKYTRSQRSKK